MREAMLSYFHFFLGLVILIGVGRLDALSNIKSDFG
jgi:hypothetical protein